MENSITLGGHFGNGIHIFHDGFHHTLQYGYIERGKIKKPDFQIAEIGKEDMIELATLLLVLAHED